MHRYFFLLLFLLAACSSQGADVPQVVGNWQPTAQATYTPLPPETAVPTPTLAAIPTIAPTETAVPTGEIPTRPPTPIPAGVYIRESDNFTLAFPANWDVSEEGQRIVLTDPSLDVYVIITSDVVDGIVSYDLLLESILSGEFGPTDMEIVSEEEVAVNETSTARIAVLEGASLENGRVAIHFGYMEVGSRFMVLAAFGTPANIAARHTTLTNLMTQAQIGTAQLYGLNRNEALVMLGGEPDPSQLDPARTTSSAAGYVGLLYSGLVRLSPTLQVVPDLAETWSVNDDGSVYTFTLREDIAFASGKPITAEDIRYSWERAADPDTGSTTAGTYLGDILGVSEKLDGEADTIAGLEVIDERTLQVTLTGPRPYFLVKITYPTAFIVNSEGIEGEGEDEWVYVPDPSGPFILHEHQEGEVFIFARNESYYAPPTIPYVIFLQNRVGSSTSLFESGEIDIVYPNTTEVQEIRLPSHALHEQWVSATSMCTSFIQMNNTIPPMDDINVRRAFALAVDKDGLNELISEGLSLRADTILPPAMPGYSLELAQSGTAYDPKAAQAALAASEYADNMPPIVLSASGFADTERNDLNALIENWREVLGVEMTVEFLDPENFTVAAHEEHGQMVSYGWCADYPDPENFLDILYHTDSDFNVAGYNNLEIDALLENARMMLDPAQRVQMYQQIEALLLEDVAGIPLLHGVSNALVNDRVEGFVLVPLGAPIFHLVSLTGE